MRGREICGDHVFWVVEMDRFSWSFEFMSKIAI